MALGYDLNAITAQTGHTDPTFTLRVYSHAMRRDETSKDRSLVPDDNGTDEAKPAV